MNQWTAQIRSRNPTCFCAAPSRGALPDALPGARAEGPSAAGVTRRPEEAWLRSAAAEKHDMRMSERERESETAWQE